MRRCRGEINKDILVGEKSCLLFVNAPGVCCIFMMFGLKIAFLFLFSLLSNSFLPRSTRILSSQIANDRNIPNSSFVHIHIPKTGGIAIESFLLKYFPSQFVFTFSHNYGAQHFPNNICLTAVRDPRDRFISAYKYWRYGSDLYFRGNEMINRMLNITTQEEWICPITSIFDFMNAAGNSSHPYHSYVLHRLNASEEGRGIDDAQTWGVHFQPQSNWLQGANRQNIVILRYSSSPKVFAKRFFKALQYLSLNPPNETQLEPINTSSIKSNSTNSSIGINLDVNSGVDLGINSTQLNVNSTTNSTNLNLKQLPLDDSCLSSQYHNMLKRVMKNYSWFNKFYAEDLVLWYHISNHPIGGFQPLNYTNSKVKSKQWRAVF